MAPLPDHRPPSLGVMLTVELGLGILAVALALIFGLAPWQEWHLSGSAVLLGVLATLPMALSLLLLDRVEWPWLSELERLVERVLVPWFRNMSAWGLLLVALSAGVCEELLFRGVIQAWLDGIFGSVIAVVAGSLIFGLAHALNRAYFIVATVAGAYLGLLYLVTDNLLVPMLVHFLYDWFALRYYLRRFPRHPPEASDRLEA
ncbi:MAG: CPBP family intramembrane glutamic endopeptidase [Wenzhouxiangella sp.]|nr:CPBP family intramembrane glutamic endopeptidase [Wenzhouxiangella sp.]